MKTAQGINFLKDSSLADLSQSKTFRYLKVSSLVLLISYSFFIAGFFIYWLYLQKSSEKISSQYSIQKQKIIDLQGVESQELVLKQRLTLLSKLFLLPKTDYQQILSLVDEVTSLGISLTKIEIDDEGNLLLSGEAENASNISSFLDNFINAYQTNEKTTISLSSLNRGKDGRYRFNLLLKKNEKS